MLRVALIHDWLTGMRGGEKALEVFCELFPGADLFTLVYLPGTTSPLIEKRTVKRSAIQRLPFAGKLYRQYLPLFPIAIEQFDLDGYDLVISTSHCAAKSVVVTGRARHLCYCLTPMRYAWDQFDAYFGPDRVGKLGSMLLRPVLAGLARWDRATEGRVHRYLAISQYVARRIALYYNRQSTLVYPPVTVFGDGMQTRSFCFISDLAGHGIIRLMLSKEAGPINIGNPQEMTIEQIARLIIEMTGSKSQIVYKPLPTDDPKVRQPDITLARTLLGWEPKVSLEQGLGRTIDYFRAKVLGS